MLQIIASKTSEENNFSENKYISIPDNRSWAAYSKEIYLSMLKERRSRQNRINNPFKDCAHNLFPNLQNDQSYSEDFQPWLNAVSSRLIVLIHGLNSSPLCWSNYIQKLAVQEKSIHYFAPYVYKKGYCKLKNASKPIFDVIQKYANQYPDNPIVLIGHSNGARIVQDIERKLKVKNVKLISIAGPHLGSKMVNCTTFLGLNSWLGISDSMANELQHDSDWIDKKLTKWQNESVENVDKVAKRIFFSSADDMRVFPNTSFPNLPSSTYYLIGGESHVTIVDAVCEKALEEALQ